MNEKRAKSLRKLVGFVPVGERTYEWFLPMPDGWQTRHTHMERVSKVPALGENGEPTTELVRQVWPLTGRNQPGTPRANYQQEKRG